MIDAHDNLTKNLDLGAEPKKRGRPKTGTALSGAVRQRAYRERQQQALSRNDNSRLSQALEEALAIVEDLQVKLRVEHELGSKARSRAAELQERVSQLESEQASKRAEVGPGRTWRMQYKVKGSRYWTTTKSMDEMHEEEAFRRVHELVAKASESDRNSQWRALRNDGAVFNPKDCK